MGMNELHQLIAKLETIKQEDTGDVGKDYMAMAQKDMDSMPNDAAVMELIAELYQKLHMKYKDQDYAPMKEVKQENTSEDKGNIAGYLNTIDEYVEMLFKGSKDTDTSEIAYRIQNAVDDIRMRELGLKPSNIRSKYNKIENEDNQNEDAHNDLNIVTQKLYNILSNEQQKDYSSLPDDAKESAEDLIGHLGEFMARLQGDQGAFDQ